MNELQQLWQCTIAPVSGFKTRAEASPHLGTSLKDMLLWRVPVAFLDSVLIVMAARWQYELLRSGQSPMTAFIEKLLGERGTDLANALRDLPPLSFGNRVVLWLILLAPLGVLGVWIHHAVWDHTCLWMLGGLKHKRGFRTSLIAEAEALKVGVLGAVLGLLSNIPVLGTLLSLPLFAVGVYFWMLRGFALAAFHDCPPWQGVTATLLHALLLLCCTCALVAAFAALVFQASI